MPEIYRTDLPNIMHEIIDDEAVIVNIDNGSYYSFDGVGSRIWGLLDGDGRDLESLIAKIDSLYTGESDRIASTVASFVGRLRDEKLVNIVPGSNGGTAGAMDDSDVAGSPVEFVNPILQKYTDMEALLLADPIHEVEEAGWPNLK